MRARNLRGSSVYNQKIEQLVCDECKSTGLLHDSESGELVCQNCGYVLSTTIIDYNPEWRAFDYTQRDKLPRVGAKLTLSIHDMGLSSTMGWQDRDYTGRKFKSEDRATIYRLRKWDQRSKLSHSTERNLASALSSITAICSKLNLPGNIVETGSMIYRSAFKRRLIKGRSIHSLAAASVYIACRQCGVIRSLEDVAFVSDIQKKELARNYRFLVTELKPRVPLSRPSRHISKIVSGLGLRGDIEVLAVEILNRASEMKLTIGRSPNGMAAACVYISSLYAGERITQSEIAKVAQVTEVTVRNRYKELSESLNLIVSARASVSR